MKPDPKGVNRLLQEIDAVTYTMHVLNPLPVSSVALLHRAIGQRYVQVFAVVQTMAIQLLGAINLLLWSESQTQTHDRSTRRNTFTSSSSSRICARWLRPPYQGTQPGTAAVHPPPSCFCCTPKANVEACCGRQKWNTKYSVTRCCRPYKDEGRVAEDVQICRGIRGKYGTENNGMGFDLKPAH